MTVLGESMQKAPAVHSRCRGIFYGIFGFFGSVMCACNSLQGEPSRKHLCFLFVSPKTDAVSVNQSPATLASYALRFSSASLSGSAMPACKLSCDICLLHLSSVGSGRSLALSGVALFKRNSSSARQCQPANCPATFACCICRP